MPVRVIGGGFTSATLPMIASAFYAIRWFALGEVLDDQSIYLNSAAPQLIGNTIAYGEGHGIYLTNQANPQIEENHFLQNGQSGVYITNSSSPNVQNNTFTRNQAYAVELDADSKPVFGGNATNHYATNAIKVTGTISGGTTWAADVPLRRWRCDHTQRFYPDPQTGLVVKFLDDAIWTIDGSLVADGTETSQIVLTSLYDDIYGGDTNNDGDATSPAQRDWGSLVFEAPV